MAKIRIYELAKELNMSSKELVEKISELNIGVHSHMSSIEEEDAKLIKEIILDENKKETLDNDDDNIIEEVKIEPSEYNNDFEDKNTKKKKSNKKKSHNREFDSINKISIEQPTEKSITIESEITVKELAERLDVNPAQVITKLIALGIMATQNQTIGSEIAELIAEEFGYKVEIAKSEEESEIDKLDYEDDPKDLIPRPPVVTVMGHVDHGKTSLLDAIRHTNVTVKEAGGITQHIGAYTVNINNKKIVFLDTPGHEAFTSMRARGAKITDIAILVVAADDGVMPQTVEAISHAKAANVPIIVAINKIDKPEANIDRVKQELAEHGILSEDWGGDTIMVPVSAKNKIGIEDLLEMILLVAEMQELKANPNRKAVGTIIEAQLDKGRGPVATVLVQKGTLNVGDMVVSGTASGRIRAMFDDKGKKVKKATPSIPVMILGLSEVPNAGDMIYAVENEKIARHLADLKKNELKEQQIKQSSKVSLDDLFERIKQGELKELNLIIKGDVRGSIEALMQSVQKLGTDEVRVNVIHSGVGGISESDVMLASASNALVLGFNVRPNLNAIEVAKKENVDIRTYRVIYEAIEDIQAAIKGMHAPKIVEEVLGRANVRATFKLPNGTSVAGIYVVNGKITRNSKIRLLRDDVVIYDGAVLSLKRFKDDVKEVQTGFEAGLALENFNDIKEGDSIEAYILKEVDSI
ncbi:MAG: translation initiation factor IF-2 [Tissierellales bacterium]|nr:translation initiation factor IF-2 [Tissierellales bacterium]